jgi:hypothetical protein
LKTRNGASANLHNPAQRATLSGCKQENIVVELHQPAPHSNPIFVATRHRNSQPKQNQHLPSHLVLQNPAFTESFHAPGYNT